MLSQITKDSDNILRDKSGLCNHYGGRTNDIDRTNSNIESKHSFFKVLDSRALLTPHRKTIADLLS